MNRLVFGVDLLFNLDSVSFFPVFLYGKIGRFQTLNRITQNVVDECSFTFWEV